MNNFIEKLLSLLSTTSLIAVYSPSLKEKQNNIAAIQILPSARNTVDTLQNTLGYQNVRFAVLVKGSKDDFATAALADEVFAKLHNTIDTTFTNGNIINIEGSNPNYAYTTDKEDIVYNVNFFAQVEIN